MKDLTNAFASELSLNSITYKKAKPIYSKDICIPYHKVANYFKIVIKLL